MRWAKPEPRLHRAAWVKAGMAFHAAGGDSDSFNDWSARHPATTCKYRKATQVHLILRPVVSVLVPCLAWPATADGPNKQRQTVTHQSLTRAASPPKPQHLAMPATGMGASEVCERCRQPAANQHPYIAARAKPLGCHWKPLRVVPAADPLCIWARAMARALVVPLWRLMAQLSACN